MFQLSLSHQVQSLCFDQTGTFLAVAGSDIQWAVISLILLNSEGMLWNWVLLIFDCLFFFKGSTYVSSGTFWKLSQVQLRLRSGVIHPSVSFSIPSSNLFTYAHVPFTVPKLRPNNPSHDAKMLLSPISFFLRPRWSGDRCKVWQECRLCCLRGNGPQPQVLWTGSMRGAETRLTHFSFSCTHTYHPYHCIHTRHCY